MYLIITKKIWRKKNFSSLNKKKFKIYSKIDLKIIRRIKPKIIFFIHWSKKIVPEIYKKNLCIQFHTSNLPKFRGGSPIQNQILKNILKTKISAFKINNLIDGGKICLKENFTLEGTAQTIYENMEKKCLTMIKKISKMKKIIFYNQTGKPTFFKRRSEKDSDLKINKFKNLSSIYNFIRMLDASDYPKAYLDIFEFKILFSNAKINKKFIEGNFKIIKNNVN